VEELLKRKKKKKKKEFERIGKRRETETVK